MNVIESTEEKNHVIAFANAILLEEGYPENYLSMLHRYYDNSVTFAIYHKKKLIGSLRLIDPIGPCRILDFWNVKFPSDVTPSKSREMGSLAIDKQYRGKSRWPMTALLEIAADYSKQHDIKWWFASAFYNKYEKFKIMNPSCRLMEVCKPEKHQLKNRRIYSEFFDEAKSAKIFIFNLNDASYTHQFKRILKQKIKF